MQAQVYALERLRCGLCGTVFTAAPPAGIGTAKYDESAAAMIALLKYGCGLPFHRIARLEQALAIPLPETTQWDVVQPAAPRLQPAFEAFVQQAAQATVVYNDDTTMRILKLTAEARAEALPPGAKPERTGVFTSGVVARPSTASSRCLRPAPAMPGKTSHRSSTNARTRSPRSRCPMPWPATSPGPIRPRPPPVFPMEGGSSSRSTRPFPRRSPSCWRACARCSVPTSRLSTTGCPPRHACSCISARAAHG